MPQIETLGADEDVLRETTLEKMDKPKPLSKPVTTSIVGYGSLVLSTVGALVLGTLVCFPAETNTLVKKGHDVLASVMGSPEVNKTGRPADTRDYVWYYGQYVPRAQLTGKGK